MTRTLMIQGCTSDAGKSTVVAGLCRLLARQGVSVVPFKPQNMANNSAVTADGGEIGRAQALQALACGLEPHTDMNPVLLKPMTDRGCQVVINGQVAFNTDARGYQNYKHIAMEAVLAAYHRLCARYDVVLVEGAGSPAEVNLRARDIANMGFAEAVDCPVWLVADIDRGGVFAHLVGTMACLSASEQARIQGFLINRFRGDPALLENGFDWLREKTGKPVLGVLPYLTDWHLDAEDSVVLQNPIRPESGDGRLNVVVPVLPSIANHTDLDPLAAHPQVALHWIRRGQTPPPADLVVLPGSKAVRADWAALEAAGWRDYLQRHLRYGGRIIGICGGYQMLGRELIDDQGIEGEPGTSQGLGALAVSTRLTAKKALHRVDGHLAIADAEVSGYEIHMGISEGADGQRPAILGPRGADGAISADGQVLGTYWHGLFDHPAARDALLAWAGLDVKPAPDHRARRLEHLDRLADMLQAHLVPDSGFPMGVACARPILHP